jgi:hypothetical protein
MSRPLWPDSHKPIPDNAGTIQLAQDPVERAIAVAPAQEPS